MKHTKHISRPAMASQDPTLGQILSVIAALFEAIGAQLASKESAAA